MQGATPVRNDRPTRALPGNASNVNVLQAGERAGLLAESGCSIASNDRTDRVLRLGAEVRQAGRGVKDAYD